MKRDVVESLMSDFEGHAQFTENSIEYWLARDLQVLLGYTEWRNFTSVIVKAQSACATAGGTVRDHFVDVNKMIEIGKGGQREVDDMMLTRYACYLIAQNGDSGKPEIAFAQTYFAVQTRRAEVIEQRLLDNERIEARHKLTSTEKELNQVIFESTGGNQDFAIIRSKGDQALFSKNTMEMKAHWKIPEGRPLADFAPTIVLKAKDFAAEITIFNTRQNEIRSSTQISSEHVANNDAVRQALLARGIRPEALPPAEDVKKVERRLQTDEKRSLQQVTPLDSNPEG